MSRKPLKSTFLNIQNRFTENNEKLLLTYEEYLNLNVKTLIPHMFKINYLCNYGEIHNCILSYYMIRKFKECTSCKTYFNIKSILEEKNNCKIITTKIEFKNQKNAYNTRNITFKCFNCNEVIILNVITIITRYSSSNNAVCNCKQTKTFKHSYNYVKQIVQSYNYKLLDKIYINSRVQLKLKCKVCGTETKCSFNQIDFQGKYCKVCKRNKKQQEKK